jgi:signal transduction histidine kinase/ligand-binding sensor domain-containing protein
VPIRVLLLTCAALICGRTAFALDPSLDISQYAHTSWIVRDGFSLGNIYAMAQTPDGYLWLGSEFGLFRFDGVHPVQWQPPAGQKLPDKNINALLVTRDGTLWIGTFAGLVTWSDGKLTSHAELGRDFVASLFEDRDGTVWVGLLEHAASHAGRLCAIRNGSAQCLGEDGSLGRSVWALYQDSSGTLWAAAQSGLWRIKPGPPKQFPTPTELIGLNKTNEGRLLVAMHGAGLLQLAGDRLESYPVRRSINSTALLQPRDLDVNRLLRDRDGGLWIGTVQRGLIHVHQGRTDVFTKSDGLSGDVILSMLEDREGNVWVASTGGLDRLTELPVATISMKQGLPSDASHAVLAARDGSVWFGAPDNGLTKWENGKTTTFRKANGLPHDMVQSLFCDHRRRIWAFTAHGLAYFEDGRFVAVNGIPSTEVYSIAGDEADNLWLSGNRGLTHLLKGRLVEHFPWSALGRSQQAKVILCDHGGVWLSFWTDGGVMYFKDGQVRASYTAADGLGEGHVPDLQLDGDGAIWAATQGGLSRLRDGRIATLTTKNGLPCNAIHWSIEDDDQALWLNSVCGLVRITRSELDAWIANPNRRIDTRVWDASDGVRLSSNAPSSYAPPVAKSTDGKIWFVAGIVQVVDPHHLAINKLVPPVHVEQVTADRKIYWQNLAGAAVSNLRLAPRIRDLQIDYTALSLVAPEKVHFKYMLEGQDQDWKEVVNDRQAQYTNLPPRHYRFRVIASNNSGVWNEEGAALDFVIPPAWYQTNWFRALCLAAFLALLWALYQLRLRQVAQQFNMRLEERVGERTRIARDLHDTLLQSFHGVLLYFQTGINQLPEHPVEARTAEARKTLEKAIHQAERAIVEGRQAIQGLRSSVVETNDLALAMRTLGEELAANADSTAFQVHVEGTPRDLHPILRDEVYRITGESMRNAFHHADAKQIEVEIHYDDRRLRVRVRDDGKGINPKLMSDDGREGHFGLRGMRERAKLIGGKLTVWSELDAGTEVELSIPAARAYTAPSGQRSWLAEKLANLSRKDTELKS